MPSLSQLTVASALLALGSAVPFKQGFSVSQVAVPRPAPKNGPAALARAYQKYGKEVPTHVADAAASISTGSVVATPASNDEQYTCPVSIGGQTVNLDFDTGSSDLWVFSTLTPSSESAGHNKYDPDQSSTAQKIDGASWNISYGDGSGASGDVYTDTVTIGGTTVVSQAVEPATSVSAQFTQDTASDGLVGLAFDNINTVQPEQQKTFFSNALTGLPNALFTADLRHNAPGAYNFGYIDDSAYTGDITYTDVDNSQGFWMITADGYKVGNDDSTASTTLQGIADTGTTLMLIDEDEIVSGYYGQIQSAQNSQEQGGYIFDCTETLPDFTLVVAGYNAVIPGEYINFAEIGDGTCFGGIQSTGGIGFGIFGDVFLKSQFVVFDNTPRLGLAAKELS